jgi:zinc resistance-associated protein
MWKSVVAGAAALAIAGTSLVYAQQRDHGTGAGVDQGAHARRGLSQEDRAAFTDARIAALKAGLRLTPDQEKNWPAFETALRDIAKTRQERMSSRRQDEPAAADPVERLRRQADALTKAGENLKRLADAQEPLYQSLDDSQKNRFNLLSRVLTGHRHFAQMREHRRMMRRMHERDHGNDGGRMNHRMGPATQEGTTGEQL